MRNKIVLEILEAKQRKFSHKWLLGPYTIPEWIPEAKQLDPSPTPPHLFPLLCNVRRMD